MTYTRDGVWQRHFPPYLYQLYCGRHGRFTTSSESESEESVVMVGGYRVTLTGMTDLWAGFSTGWTSPPLTTPRTGNTRRWCPGDCSGGLQQSCSWYIGGGVDCAGAEGHPLLLHSRSHESQGMEHYTTPSKKNHPSQTLSTLFRPILRTPPTRPKICK